MGRRLLVLRVRWLPLLSAVCGLSCTAADDESTIDVTEADWGAVAFDVKTETERLVAHEGAIEPLFDSLHHLATDLLVSQGGYRFALDPQNIETGLMAHGEPPVFVELTTRELHVNFGEGTHLVRSDLTLSGQLVAGPGAGESMTIKFSDFGIEGRGASAHLSGTMTFMPDLTGTGRSFPPSKTAVTTSLDIVSVGTLDLAATFELASTDEPETFQWTGRGRFLTSDATPIVDRYGFACSPGPATLVATGMSRSVSSCGGRAGSFSVKRAHVCTPNGSFPAEEDMGETAASHETTSRAQLRWPTREAGDLVVEFEGFVDLRPRATGLRMVQAPGCSD